MADPPRLEVAEVADLPRVLAAAGLSATPVLVVVGGAGGMDAQTGRRLEELFATGVVTVVERRGATVVDGGTASGVMRTMGAVRAARRAWFPLVGVAARGTLAEPGTTGADRAAPDPHHTHLVVVPGTTWGEESPWLGEVATTLARGHPSATLLANGGEVAWQDVEHSLAAGRPVVVLSGTGRTADAIADALAAAAGDDVHRDPDVDVDGGDGRAARVARSPLVHVVPADDPAAVGTLLDALLAGPAGASVTPAR